MILHGTITLAFTFRKVIPTRSHERGRELTFVVPRDAERDAAVGKLKNNEVTRFKGLGEISPKEFKQFISNDDHLRRVVLGSMSDVKQALDFFMGKNTPARKDYIIEHLIADIA